MSYSVLCCSVSVDMKLPYHRIVHDAMLLRTWSIKSSISESFSYCLIHFFSPPSFNSFSLLSLLSFIQTISLTPPLSSLSSQAATKYPIRGSEEMMKKKAHGTSDSPVQSNLKYGCDVALADRICNFNRRFAEHAGVWSYLCMRQQDMCLCLCVVRDITACLIQFIALLL
jgi:hypothetical protein